MTRKIASHFPNSSSQRRPQALVTGGAKRIGAGLVEALAGAGFDLLLHYRGSAEHAAATAERARGLGAEVALFPADLTQPDSVELMLNALDVAQARPQVLINNASLFEDDDAFNFDVAALHRHMQIHVATPTVLARWMARGCVGRGDQGAIINMIDQRVLNPSQRHFTYAVSKQALWGLTQQLALDLAPSIRVNAIAPGPILPPPGSDGATFHKQTGAMPLGRGASVEEIAEAALFLLGAPAITGAIIPVDGGQHMGYMSPGEAQRFVNEGVRPG